MGLDNDSIKQWMQELFADGSEMLNSGDGCYYDDCPFMALLQNSSLLPAVPLLRSMGTTEATLRMENVDVKDEWQDEDLPRYSSPDLCVSHRRSGPGHSPRWGAGGTTS